VSAEALSAQVPTYTPNLNLIVPAFGQNGWQVPLDQDLYLLDKYLSGNLALPALSLASFTIPYSTVPPAGVSGSIILYSRVGGLYEAFPNSTDYLVGLIGASGAVAGQCVQFDSAGNLAAAGGSCGIGGGVASGVAGQAAYYALNGAIVTGRALTTGSGIQKADGSGWLTTAGAADYPVSSFQYSPPNSTSPLGLVTYLEAQLNDVRNWGGVGVTGNCHASTVDNKAAIQAALNSAWINGPPDVYLPVGYCWPIQTHIWVPPNVHFHSEGRTSGYEVSSATGAVLIANANWGATNTALPYSQMVWNSGSDCTSGTCTFSGVTFASEIDHLEINCNDQPGCGSILGIGRQEKSTWHDLLLTGSVPFSGGYSHVWFEQGVDCGGYSPGEDGCLLLESGQAGTGPAGPDYNIEVYPSYSNCQANVVPISLQGLNGYKGLSSVTVGGVCGFIPYAGYVWGSTFSMGTNGLMHDETTTHGWYIGSDPAGTGCNGANDALFENFEHALTIASCGAQYALTFINDAGGVINNQNSTTTGAQDYYFDSGPPNTFGWPGIQYPAVSTSTLTYNDPGGINYNGRNGISLYYLTPRAGLNEQWLQDAGSIYMRASVCSDGWWNTATQLWQVGANGAGDVGCLLFGNGWVGESEYAGTINTTITQTTMNNNVVRATNTAGHVFFGKGIISNSSGGILPTDNGSIVQVQGPISATMFASGLAANTDWTGEALLSAATSIAVSVSGAYGSHLECFAEPQFDIGVGNRHWITYAGSTSFTINFATAVSGNVSYGCHGRN
jgi:hypothetical protein